MSGLPPAPAPSFASDRNRFAAVGLTGGVVAAALLVDHGPGVNVVIVGAFMATAVLMVARHALDHLGWAFGFTGFAFLVMFAVRTSEPLLLADLCAAAGLGSLALTREATWPGVVLGGIAVLTKLHRGAVAVLSPVRDAWAGFDRVARAPVLRGIAIGFPLVLIFGALFASADRAFAQIVGDALVPAWDLGRLPFWTITALVTISFTGAYALVATEGPPSFIRAWAPPRVAQQRQAARAEWVIPLVLVDLVFLSFVVIQMAVLFGGHEHVLSTAGLTYAQYAREGFFQLVVIAALSLTVTGAAVHFGAPSEHDRNLARVLLGSLCVLTLVILVSALRRLGLYEEAFGFTRLRFAVHVVILWMGALIFAVMVAGTFWRGSWLPRITASLAALALLVVNVIDPDAFIASKNLDRYRTTGKIDTVYLSNLSLDAVPVLVQLPVEIRRCVLARFSHLAFERGSMWSYNVSREQARGLLAGISGTLGSPSECPS